MIEMNDSLKIKGSVRCQLFDKNGTLIYDQTDRNLVVTSGKTYLAAWLVSTSFMPYVGLGTGTTAPTSGETGLQSPFGIRVAGSLTSASNVWQNVVTFLPGVDTNAAITEAGLFSALTGGTMFAHKTFGAVSKGASDTFVLTWQVTFN